MRPLTAVAEAETLSAGIYHAPINASMPVPFFLSHADVARFRASPLGVAPDRGIAALEWISVAGAATGRSRIDGLVIVSNFDDGALLGVVDGAAVVAMRSAAETLIAARRLA